MEKATAITSMMAEKRVINPPDKLSKRAYIKSMAEYKKIYKESIDDPEGFWYGITSTVRLLHLN